MSALYSVGHLKTTRGVFHRMPAEHFEEMAGATLYSDVLDAGAEALEEDQGAGAVRQLCISTLRDAGEGTLLRLVMRAADCGEDEARALLAAMSTADRCLWRAAVASTNEDEDPLMCANDVLCVQELLHDALPGRFVLPHFSEVQLDVACVHPDAGMLEADAFHLDRRSMAGRLLIDSGPEHPLRAFFPEPWDRDIALWDVVVRAEIEDRRLIPTEAMIEERRREATVAGSEGYFEAFWRIWLPEHMVGDLKGVGLWDSAAFA